VTELILDGIFIDESEKEGFSNFIMGSENILTRDLSMCNGLVTSNF
jgi:hypothetical protein